MAVKEIAGCFNELQQIAIGGGLLTRSQDRWLIWLRMRPISEYFVECLVHSQGLNRME